MDINALKQAFNQKKEAYNRVKKGANNLTYEECYLAICYDSQILSCIPPVFITDELWKKALSKNSSNTNLIKYIPKNLLTEKNVCSIVEINGIYLKYLPLETINEDIIIKAVKQTTNAVLYIPDKYKSNELYKKIIDITPKALKYIKNPNIDLCEYALNNSPSAISYLKDTSHLPFVLYENAVKADWKNLKYVYTKRITKKLCEDAFASSWKAFKFFPNKFKTMEHCKTVILKDVNFLQYCPPSLISYEMSKLCIQKCGKLLKFVPNVIKTEDLCLLAIEQNHESFDYVPEKLLTIEFYIRCLEKNWASIQFVPQQLKTSDNYKKILPQITFSKKFNNWLLSDEKEWPLHNSDYNKFQELKLYVSMLDNFELDYDLLKAERKLHLRKTKSAFYDKDTKLFTVEEDYFKNTETRVFSTFNDFYLYLNKNLEGANITEYQFEGIDTSNYNLNGAYLCSKLLIEKGLYNGDFYNSSIARVKEAFSLLPISSSETIEASSIQHEELYTNKLNINNRKIFYISDIHLETRLIENFKTSATYDEIRFFIKKYVKKIFGKCENEHLYELEKCTPYDNITSDLIVHSCNSPIISNTSTLHYDEQQEHSDDYLLIGGDVSPVFEISKLFYLELCQYWPPSKIVVILGNHELWDYSNLPCPKQVPSKPEETIEKYKIMLTELGINFLQNSILVVKQYSSSILSETELLTQSIDELRKYALDSNLLIFGGIGFSGYNPTFNASAGIYRGAISSIDENEELYYTQRSENVYNKIRETFYNDRLIIFSHMHPTDWTKSRLVPNWIYVNGHTHHNHYIQTNDCTVFADNQIGYTAKHITLKYFTTSLNYDIFKYYDDGIHYITKKQYLDFNYGNGTRCTLKKDVKSIVMLKRQGIYLFLLEDKEKNKLFLLNGGITNRLKVTDLNYYYNNMLKYADYIKLGIKKYNESLKSISNIIKEIGGKGTIHGCIVDIDFYNHIYLNPENGSISAYYSPVFGHRYEYSTVEQLLEKQIPQLYSNYKKLLGPSTSLVVMQNIDILSSEATHVLDTTQYQPSRLIKRLQYITENNVIRIWSDDFLSCPEQYIEEKQTYLPN